MTLSLTPSCLTIIQCPIPRLLNRSIFHLLNVCILREKSRAKKMINNAFFVDTKYLTMPDLNNITTHQNDLQNAKQYLKYNVIYLHSSITS